MEENVELIYFMQKAWISIIKKQVKDEEENEGQREKQQEI